MRLRMQHVELAFVSTTEANYVARLEELVALLVATGASWSLTESGSYDSVVAYAIATHSSGAQLCLFASWVATSPHADNIYDSDTGNPQTLRIAFKPSSKKSTPYVMSDTVNPTDVATWCADYGSYTFARHEHNTSDLDAGASGRVYLVADLDSAFIYLIGLQTTGAIRDAHMYCDDAFIELGDPDDDEGSLVSYHTILNPGTTIQCQYWYDGAIVETAIPYELTEILSRESVDPETTGEPISLVELVRVAGTVKGRKGLVDPRIFSWIRTSTPDTYRVEIRDYPGAHLIHYDQAYKCLIPWAPNAPFIL